MEIKPAIVVVAYRRVETLQRLLCSIDGAIYNLENVTLIISIDFHPENYEVIKCAETFEWSHGEKIIKKHTQNMGLLLFLKMMRL